ncbi:MAG: caspase family protein [Brumimicrobium sp.]|nr:caspase family protein [Brumimicrobium sp.]
MLQLKLIFFLLLLIVFNQTKAQTTPQTKGIEQVYTEPTHPVGNIYALIVGLSKYQYPETYTPLQFADKDARVFYTYLRSDAGGKVPSENIDTLFNERATYGEVMSKLLSIKDRMKENDLLYFYFSGHGDAYNAAKAFLLPYDAPSGNGRSDKNHYLIGTTVLDIYTIKVIFKDLTSNGRKVIFISDACRTNELSGGEEGRTSVFKKIMEDDAGEIRFSSCSSNQVSYEDVRWGGGRGLFSWHLVNGLIGMADTSPKDGEVTVDELVSYVKTQVKNASYDKATKTYKQTPQFDCKAENCETFVLNLVNDTEKNRLAQELQKGDNSFYQDALATSSPAKGVNLPIEMDKIGFKALYNEFVNHLQNNELIGENSAATTFQKIMLEETIPTYLVNEFRGILSSRLITDVNKIINTYINAAQNNNLYTYDYFYTGYLKLKEFIKIADTLFYIPLDAKVNLLFLEAHANWKTNRTSELKSSLEKIDSAVILKPEASYLYNLKGVLHQRLKQYKEASLAFHKGMKLAPGWIYPTHNLGLNFSYLGQRDSSFYYYFKALELDTNYQTTYSVIAQEYAHIDDYESFIKYVNKGLSKDPTDPSLLLQKGNYYYYQKEDYDKALSYYIQSFSYDKSFLYGYENALKVHIKKMDSDSTKFYINKIVERDSTNPEIYFDIGIILSEFSADSMARTFFNYAIYYDSLNIDYWNAYANSSYKLEDYNTAHTIYLKSLEIDSTNNSTYALLGTFYYNLDYIDYSLNTFLKGLTFNPKDYLLNFNVGYLYYLQKAYNDAAHYFLISLENNKFNQDTYYYLAGVYAQLNDKDKALFYLENYLKLVKDFDRKSIEEDEDLQSIKKSKEFKNLLNRYTSKSVAH